MRRQRYRLSQFLAEFEWAATNFYEKRGRGFEKFLHGASVHFHVRLIEIFRRRGGYPSRWADKEPYYVDLLYAMLAAWGMDSQQARLVDFPEFESRVYQLVRSEPFRHFEEWKVGMVDASAREPLAALWSLVSGDCKVMASESAIVASSKLLHHLLPDCFVPIDRSYTLDLLSQLEPSEPYRLSANQVMKPDFQAFLNAMLFFGETARQVQNIEKHVGRGAMSGSVPKVIDNAVIAWWGTT